MDVRTGRLRARRRLTLPRVADPEIPRLSRRILEILRGAKRPRFSIERLAKAVGASAAELDRALAELEEAGEIVRGPKKRVALIDRAGLVSGRVHAGRRGRAVVVPDVPDRPLSLSRGAMRPALDGDRVLCEESPYSQRGLRGARIVRVIERVRKTVVGVVSEQEPRRLLPVDSRIGEYVVTLAEDSEGANPGEVVVADIAAYPTGYTDIVVRVARVLGPIGKLATEIRAVCHSVGIPREFSEEVLAEAEALAGEPDAPDAQTTEGRRAFTPPSPHEVSGREDLRDTLTFTIDPADAKDHDDAVAIEETDDGFRLTVSIADVAHYVRPGTAIDREAFERGNSTYFPGECVPMLPERISGDLASLHAGIDRLAVSVFLDIDASGRVTATRFARTLIRSMADLTYERVQAALDGAADHDVPANLVGSLDTMARCAAVLLERRMARGAIDLDLRELAVEVDERGEPVAIAARERLFAHRIIEELMLAANEAVARRLEATSTPFLYRVHERPDVEAGLKLAGQLRAVGMRMREGIDVEPEALQAVLRECAEHAEAATLIPHVNLLVLRSMTKAHYSADKDMHFGLASSCYTHFTSPIRRYPDLVVHRALVATIDAAVAALPGQPALRPVAEQCSERERRSMDAERDVVRAAGVLLAAPHVGRTFAGTVTGVARWGYHVELDGINVEGFCHVGRLDEHYEFVRERLELISRTSSACIRIGDRVDVVISAVDLADRSIELEPA